MKRILLFLSLWLLAVAALAKDYREIDWLELMPPEEIALLEKLQSSIDHEGTGPVSQFESAKTVDKMDGVEGKLVGYIVPIGVSPQNEILEFFLVPYFGACIHVPPPPPNQIIHVKPDKPLPMVDIWDPYWVEGTVRIRKVENAMAKSSYAIDPVRVVPYQ